MKYNFRRCNKADNSPKKKRSYPKYKKFWIASFNGEGISEKKILL